MGDLSAQKQRKSVMVESVTLNEQNTFAMQKATQKEHNKLTRLREVKVNIENNCRKDLEKLDAIKKRSLKQQTAAYENKRDNKFDGVEKKNKVTERVNKSKAHVKKTNNEIAKVSMVYYKRYQGEAQERTVSKMDQDKKNSALEFKISKDDRKMSVAVDGEYSPEASPDREDHGKSTLN
jgi:hypothetical protein